MNGRWYSRKQKLGPRNPTQVLLCKWTR